MSIEPLEQSNNHYIPFNEYAEQALLNELVCRQNEELELDEPIVLSASLQKLCAESLIRDLREKPYFQKFGGKALNIVMMPTSEPYMFNVCLTFQPVETN